MSNRAAAVLAGLVLGGAVAALAIPDVLSQPLIAGEARVIDGNILEILPSVYGGQRQRIRIAGIDAPELGQMCGVIYCGLAARDALQRAVGGSLVTCKPSGLDRYGRTLSQCATSSVRDLGAHMVGAGMARSHVGSGGRYRDAEDAARAERVGLWRLSGWAAAADHREADKEGEVDALTTAAVIGMVLLHRPDGGEVAVAPSHVTSLHAKAPTAGANKLVVPEARCVVWLADGKLLSVVEPCDLVRKMLEEAGGK